MANSTIFTKSHGIIYPFEPPTECVIPLGLEPKLWGPKPQVLSNYTTGPVVNYYFYFIELNDA